MRLQKRLLGGMQKRAVKGRAARHAAHRKHLQLGPFPAEIRVRLIPVHLRLNAPGIALRDKRLVCHQTQRDFPVVSVLTNRPFADLAFRHLSLNPFPDAMCRVPLLPWRLLVRFQNLVHERYCRRQFPPRPLHFLSPRRYRAPNRLSYHSPVHPQFLRDSGDRSDPELVLPSDLLK